MTTGELKINISFQSKKLIYKQFITIAIIDHCYIIIYIHIHDSRSRNLNYVRIKRKLWRKFVTIHTYIHSHAYVKRYIMKTWSNVGHGGEFRSCEFYRRESPWEKCQKENVNVSKPSAPARFIKERKYVYQGAKNSRRIIRNIRILSYIHFCIFEYDIHFSSKAKHRTH